MTLTTSLSPERINLTTLPCLPQTLVELIEACNSVDVDIISVGEIVARDVTISARILQLANSAFLGTKAAFSDIEQAVIYLGIDTVRNLAVSVSVYEALRSQSNADSINMLHFWYHALHTAILAKSLAEAAEYESPAEAYLAGLLHDLGKLLLASNYPEQYPEILEEGPQQLSEKEKSDLGICHGEAGALLARHWHLQEEIAGAIATHHDSQPFTGYTLQLSHLIQLANNLCHAPQSADFPDPVSTLDPSVLEECRHHALETVESIAQAMGISVKKPEEIEPALHKNAAQLVLQDRVGSVTQIYGALDNLLKADNQTRICRVMEETLQILLGITKCFIILPVGSSGSCKIAISSTNPIQPCVTEMPVPEMESRSIIEKCRLKGVVSFTSRHDESIQPCDEDNELISFLGCEGLVALPIPLQQSTNGVLVAGLSQDQFRRLALNLTPFRLLADHCGARFQFEQIQEQRLNELTQKELEAVESVTSSIAHEISNPLGIVQSYLSVIERKIAKQIDTTHDLQLISDEIERIGTIVRQLENISSLTTAEPVKRMRLDALLRDIVTFFRESIFLEHQIDVQIRLEPLTRSLSVPTHIMRQVFTILLTNAADSLSNGGKVVVSSRLGGSNQHLDQHILHLSVSDDGPGIDATIARSLFNAGSTTKGGGHLGLGLSIARKVLIDSGGTITCDPTAKKGACFTVTIPIS